MDSKREYSFPSRCFEKLMRELGSGLIIILQILDFPFVVSFPQGPVNQLSFAEVVIAHSSNYIAIFIIIVRNAVTEECLPRSYSSTGNHNFHVAIELRIILEPKMNDNNEPGGSDNREISTLIRSCLIAI